MAIVTPFPTVRKPSPIRHYALYGDVNGIARLVVATCSPPRAPSRIAWCPVHQRKRPTAALREEIQGEVRPAYRPPPHGARGARTQECRAAVAHDGASHPHVCGGLPVGGP
jgi:hypothetical protein